MYIKNRIFVLHLRHKYVYNGVILYKYDTKQEENMLNRLTLTTPLQDSFAVISRKLPLITTESHVNYQLSQQMGSLMSLWPWIKVNTIRKATFPSIDEKNLILHWI